MVSDITIRLLTVTCPLGFAASLEAGNSAAVMSSTILVWEAS